MRSIRSLKSALIAFAALAAGGATAAQAATCGITGSATAQPQPYDPFNPAGYPTTQITLNLQRVNASGGGFTEYVSFYLKGQDSGTDGTIIVPTSITGSVNQGVSAPSMGLNIFHNFNQTAIVSPTSVLASATNRIFRINFTGNDIASNTASVTFNVTLPPNIDLAASTNLAFDAIFGCNIQGGRDNGKEQTGQITNAVSFPITVLSALQTSFVGTALDFGEIGDVDNAAAPTRNTGTGKYVRVQSSGAYTVSLTSANAYRLKHPLAGASPAANQLIRYKIRFLGTERNSANTTAINQQCDRAGVPAVEADRLGIQAVLEEGGAGKAPSQGGLYQDTLTVTVTPKIIGTNYPTDCTTLLPLP